VAIQSSNSLPQFFTDTPCRVGDCVSLSDADTHHAEHVLRLRDGERVRIAYSEPKEDGKSHNHVFLGVLKKSSVAPLQVDILEELHVPSTALLPPPVQSLIFGMSKGKKNELVIEKATELGVQSIILWQTSRSILRLKDENEAARRTERFSKIAEAAAKQSKRNSIPLVHICLTEASLAKELERLAPGPRLCCSLSPNSRNLSEIAYSSESRMSTIAIGPEGDFSPKEEQWLAAHSFSPVRLGENILRSETAAIAAIAMVNVLCEISA
jgi:16S rRNA (uracil1498-N3)-methyltransferase